MWLSSRITSGCVCGGPLVRLVGVAGLGHHLRSGRRPPAARSARGGTACGRRPPAREWARAAIMPPAPGVRAASAPRKCPTPAPTPPPPWRRCCCARSRMMRRPTWVSSGPAPSGSKPQPSSRTSTRHCGVCCTSTHTSRACACLRTLDRASCTTCSTCTCTSAGSGRPSPSMSRWVARPVWCSNFCSVVFKAGAMSSAVGAGAEVHQQLAHVAQALVDAGVQFAQGPVDARGIRRS